MTPQTVILIMLYLAFLAVAGAAIARVLAYAMATAAQHADRVAARRAAHIAWVLAQPAAYHEQRMIETYR